MDMDFRNILYSTSLFLFTLPNWITPISGWNYHDFLLWIPTFLIIQQGILLLKQLIVLFDHMLLNKTFGLTNFLTNEQNKYRKVPKSTEHLKTSAG